MKQPSKRDEIAKILREKSCMKQDVFAKATEVFMLFKEVLTELASDLSEELEGVDKRIEIGYKSRGQYEAQIKFAGDVLLFHMHTNVFDFDKSHPVWRTSYAREKEYSTFCGVINVYNFLSDSLRFNRINDSGYLVARIFINREGHFFVEGKKQLGILFNDFVNSEIKKSDIKRIVESCMHYSLNFDLLTPPYDLVREITVNEIEEITNNMKIKTAKRLGFQFEAENNFDD